VATLHHPHPHTHPPRPLPPPHPATSVRCVTVTKTHQPPCQLRFGTDSVHASQTCSLLRPLECAPR
jgi:hypothetical protein